MNNSSSLSRYTLILFALACGVAVANVYCAQPLLDQLSNEFGISPSTIGAVITITQLCYAAGLLLLVPLGDLVRPKKLIISQMLLYVLALTGIGLSPTVTVLFAGLAAVGLLASVTQTLVAYASALAATAERGRVVGFVQSGIVIGILLARTFAGLLTDVGGWRSVYLTSGALMLLLVGLLYRALPHVERPMASLSYPKLLRSTLLLFVQERTLLVRGGLAILIFASFSILWSSLVLPLSAAPYSLSHTAIGAFGLAGAAGALSAAKAGRLADRGWGQRTTGIALVLLTASWLFIGLTERSLLGLIVGIILLDLAVQAVHVTKKAMIMAVRPEAKSRLTAAYMMFYSIGSATGAILATNAYAAFGWIGVCILGATISAFALVFWGITRRFTRQAGEADVA
ncbi:MFS transporter [Paenibacillus chibensis]|uniref:MFS transporter n=1 Tax=Paenibacillus chibensis TaxID=59846 RepID=A0ABU6PTI6_9BACL|nr:MFS transporter [Paenibacillus chibensis]